MPHHCPTGFVCIPQSYYEAIIAGLIFLLMVGVVSFMFALSDDDAPRPPEDTGRPKAKKAKGK